MRGLLLDTHVFLWWRMNDLRLSPAIRSAIANSPLVFVSAASAWEASIKSSLGKLTLPESFESGVRDSEFEELKIAFSHASEAAGLPGHHGDPFDRMLIAQARVERLTLVTHDARMRSYDAAFLWV